MNLINKHINKYLNSDINWKRIIVTKNEKAYYLQIKPGVINSINFQRFLKTLPKTVDYFIDKKERYVFGLVETNQNKLDFAEVKACSIGEYLLEKKKEVLALMDEFKDSLQELSEAKKVMKGVTVE